MHDPYRPHVHITDPDQFINDPNGPVLFEGEYHVFYQRGWPKSWGHAISTDLLHWQILPPALEPDPLGDIWSGSCVVDHHNTSGFFPDGPGLVAIFTHYTEARQVQSLAWSRDRGRTWTKYGQNPVLVSGTGERNFRDPKIIWHAPTRRWVMALATHDHISFYSSPDLKRWEKAGTFGRGHGCHDGVWECPDLFELAVEGEPQLRRWVLLVSYVSQTIWQPGSDGTGAIGVQYFVGDFDGHTFVSENPPETVLPFVHGPDEYATTTFSNLTDAQGERVLAIGWLGNWNYSGKVPTEPWKHLLSLPRELYLARTSGGLRVAQRFARQLHASTIPAPAPSPAKIKSSSPVKLAPVDGPCLVDLTIDMREAARAELRLISRNANQTGCTVLTIDRSARTLILDRTRSGTVGFSPVFDAIVRAPLHLDNNAVHLTLAIDSCSIEILTADGLTYLPATIFPAIGTLETSLLITGQGILVNARIQSIVKAAESITSRGPAGDSPQVPRVTPASTAPR